MKRPFVVACAMAVALGAVTLAQEGQGVIIQGWLPTDRGDFGDTILNSIAVNHRCVNSTM